MPVKLDTLWVSGEVGERERVVCATLLRGLREIQCLAGRKIPEITVVHILEADERPADGSEHRVKILEPQATPVDYAAKVQLIGYLGGRSINAVVTGVKHGYKENGTGSYEFTMNGKPLGVHANRGGLTLDDLWQENERWKC